MRGWTAQLRLEDGQRAAYIVAADVHRAACFGKADQRHQNMLQTKRQQQEMKVSLICISLLSVFLLVAIFFVYKQMKKVAAARREVVDTNTLLQELNE